MQVSPELLADLLLVCASHCGQHYWSSEVSRKLATGTYILRTPPSCISSSLSELSALLVERSGYSSVTELLGGKRGLMGAAVAKLKARLSRSSWKEHPSAKQAMVWCLRRLRHPSVAPHLDFFLPACLLLLDDHEVSQPVSLYLTHSLTHLLFSSEPQQSAWSLCCQTHHSQCGRSCRAPCACVEMGTLSGC